MFKVTKHNINLIYSREIQVMCVFYLHTLYFVHALFLYLSQALADCVKDLLSPFLKDTIDVVAGIDAMGFILGKRTNQFILRREINSSLRTASIGVPHLFYFKRQLLF